MSINKATHCLNLLTEKFILIGFLCIISITSIFAQPGCPNVNAGNDQTLNCSTNCTNLTATFLQTGATSAYTVTSVAYSPPYAFNTGTAIMVNIDDTWSSVINLPFNFCFFGNNYTQIVVGSNGVITFNTSNAGGYCPWSFSSTCPSSSLPTNSIFGAYHDIDPSVSGTLYYAILGTAPCRTFVINFYQVAMYSSSCNSSKATHQIVLYESTNVIEVYIKAKPVCSSWNSGNAVIGIQNNAGNLGYTPPGRNTSQWTANNEAWRFTPSGPPNYAVAWFEGTTQIGNTPTINVCPSQTTTYTAKVTYTSCDGTTDIQSDQVTVNKTQPFTMSVTPATSNICLGASQSLTASGANTYSWSPSAGLSSTTGATVTASPSVSTTYTVTGTASGCTGTATAVVNITGGPSVSFSALSPICVSAPAFALSGGSPAGGTYSGPGVSGGMFNPTTAGSGTHTITYTYTNLQGCIGSATQTIVVSSSSPANAGNDQIVCQGQSVNLTAFGGVSYLWSNNSQTQSINVTPTTSTNYVVTVTDNNGCTGTDAVYVTVNPLPNASAGNPVNICSGKSAQLSASGGSSYSWAPATGLSATNIANPVAAPVATTTYTVTVLNSNGCSATSSVVASIKPLPVVTTSGTNASCSGFNNASATANVTNGSTPYQYLWSTVPAQVTQTATNLQPQVNYIVTVSDAFGCSATSNITLSTAPPITVSLTTANALCYGSNDGTASVVVNGGTTPYSYTWLPSGTAGNVSSVSTLAQGTYILQVSDINNCTKDTTFTINHPTQVNYTQNVTNATCHDGNNGAISVQVQGGSAPYTYNWSSGLPSTATVSNLLAGPYHVTVTDSHLCDTIIDFTVTEPTALTLSVTPGDSLCLGDAYTISANPSGGTPPYTYNWDNNLPSQQSHSLTAQNTTTYSVSVTDANSCVSPTVNTIQYVFPLLSVSLSATPPSICLNYSSVLQASVTGGNGGPYNYQWSTSGSGSSITVTPQQTTTFYLTVTDNCGTPPANAQVPVQVFPAPVVTFDANVYSGCVPLIVNFTHSISPVPATFLWNFGDPNASTFNTSSSPNSTHLYGDAGTYNVSLTIQTTDGCIANTQINNMIEAYPLPVASFYANPPVGSIEEPFVSFVNTSLGSMKWYWWFDDAASGNENSTTEENPIHAFRNAGNYEVELIAETNHGCRDTTYGTIHIKDIFSIYIPNAFSPNSDGINDFFAPVFTGVDEYKMLIFNRWGENIYETEDINQPWDGKVKNGTEVAMIAVYSYVIIVKDINGKDHRYIGHVTLLKSSSY